MRLEDSRLEEMASVYPLLPRSIFLRSEIDIRRQNKVNTVTRKSLDIGNLVQYLLHFDCGGYFGGLGSFHMPYETLD